MKKAWKQALAMILATGMALSLLPCWTLAADPAAGQTITEYVEVTTEADLISGGVYAIVAPNANHSVLYHTHNNKEQADQVNAEAVTATKLFLSGKYPTDAQTWILTGDAANGYSVQSNAQNDSHYLHMDKTTNPGAERIPVTDAPEPFTFTRETDGWVISRVIDDATTYYLSHNAGGQFYVSTAVETHFRLYKQTRTTVDIPEISGFDPVTNITDGSRLDTAKYYMFVGKDAAGDLYALLPGDGTNSAGIPQPALTVKLTVAGDGTVSIDRPGVNVEDLYFRAFHYGEGANVTFASKNKSGLLLSLLENMFADVAGSMTISTDAAGRVALKSSSDKYLTLNVESDPTQTGFCGLKSSTGQSAGCPIYLFAKTGEEVPPMDIDNIPGYNRITSIAQLEIGSEYMIVSADSYGDLYALYPAPDGVGVFPGTGIDPGSTLHTRYASLAAQLTVAGEAGSETVSAQYLKTDGTSEPIADMEALRFTVERTGNTFTIKYAENLYLAMMDSGFLSEGPTELSITLDDAPLASFFPSDGKFLIKDLHSGRGNTRILDFNVKGDPIQFIPGDDADEYATNFWGPRKKRYPIYIYEYIGEEVKLTPEKDRLDKVVDALLLRNPDDYTPRSWEDFLPALEAADALRKQTPAPSEEACIAELEKLRNAGSRLVPIASLLDAEPLTGDTAARPFIADEVGHSENFRSPSLVSFPNGALLAAADARWDHADPAKGVDTAFSYSADRGATWHYSFPNFFADSVNEKNSASKYAATFTDPVMVTVGDDAVYLLTDLFPGGVALQSAAKTPAAATGFGDVGGKQRLLVYENNIDKTQTDGNYTYYVGDFVDGCADLLDKSDNQPSLYYVDQYYNLYRRAYTAGAAKDPENDKLHCRQWDGDDPYGAKYVQQNLFFYSSDFHVRGASYLWLMKGTCSAADNTFTWSPALLDPQGRTDGDGKFFGAGPGRGTVTESGSIVLPTYLSNGSAGSERAGVITSTDGVNWAKGLSLPDATSEAVPVAVGDAIYLFTRGGGNYYVSTNGGAAWSAAKPTGAAYNTGCQLSAIRYSQKFNGKDAIILSAPAADAYSNGKLFVFLVEENGDLTLRKEYPLPEGYFGYSCLTELAPESDAEGGDLGLLYENSALNSEAGTNAAIAFTTVSKEALFPAPVDVSLTVGESKTFPVPESSAVTKADATIVTAAVEGAALTLTGAAAGETDVVVDDILLYRVKVTAVNTGDDGGDDGGNTGGDGGDSGSTGSTGAGHRPSRPSAPVDPVTRCPQDATCPIADYIDADPKGWYHDGAHFCIEAGLMAGYGNEHWGPGDSLTRAMLVQILYNKAGKPAVTAEVPFTDVAPDAWYADAIAWGAAKGIVEGYGNGIFAPEQPISRQDAVVILHRYNGKPAADANTLAAFSDSGAVGSWAVEAMGWAVKQGLIVGNGDASLIPQHHASRAEAASILHRHFTQS